jgi:phenylacetic acid degradation protein
MRELSADEMAWKVDATRTYQNLARRCVASLRETVALAEAEPGRKRLSISEVLPLSAWKNRKAGA